jgi:hypothetical protein
MVYRMEIISCIAWRGRWYAFCPPLHCNSTCARAHNHQLLYGGAELPAGKPPGAVAVQFLPFSVAPIFSFSQSQKFDSRQCLGDSTLTIPCGPCYCEWLSGDGFRAHDKAEGRAEIVVCEAKSFVCGSDANEKGRGACLKEDAEALGEVGAVAVLPKMIV